MWPLSPNALSVFFLNNSQQHVTIIYPNLHSGHINPVKLKDLQIQS